MTEPLPNPADLREFNAGTARARYAYAVEPISTPTAVCRRCRERFTYTPADVCRPCKREVAAEMEANDAS